jgi:hypothetical protein
MNAETLWIDCDPDDMPEMGFLVEINHENKGSTRYELRLRPPYTNQSREPRPTGWCGSYNNVSTFGRGIWRVIRRVENGRCKIEAVTDSAQLADFLEEFGYPDLLDELVPEAT